MVSHVDGLCRCDVWRDSPPNFLVWDDVGSQNSFGHIDLLAKIAHFHFVQTFSFNRVVHNTYACSIIHVDRCGGLSVA